MHFPQIPPPRLDSVALAYLLGRIRSLPPEKRARWRARGNPLREASKRLVLAQWLAEAPGNPS